MYPKRRRVKDLARQRISILLRLADTTVRKDENLAKRYVELAFSIAAKARFHVPRYVKRKYCRKCKIPLLPGFTARVRIKRGCGGRHLTVTCLRCGFTRRYPINPSK